MLILAETMEELTVRTIEVLQLLRENDLYLKPQKCEFGVTKVNFLGFIIEHGKMTMDPVKLAGIADWPAPSTLRQLRSFLGFGNFYQKFIHHYSDLTHPLNELLQKDQGYDWTPARQLAFDKLKQCFMEEPVLLLPDQTRPFQIKSDASKSNLTPPNMPLEPSLYKPTLMVTNTLVPICRNHSLPLNGTMKFTIENSLALFVPCETGDTTFKGPLTKLSSIPTTKTLPTFETHKN